MSRLFPALAAFALSACTLPRWPVEAPMSSPYGVRVHNRKVQIHKGTDIAMKTGTPVHAIRTGHVVFAGTMRGYGTTIILAHGRHTTSLYAHLSKSLVQEGEGVREGQVVALSGASGNARGPHLHLEIRSWGRPVDPAEMLGPLTHH